MTPPPTSPPSVRSGRAASDLEPVWGWARSARGRAIVKRPRTIADVQSVIEAARASGRSIALRGSGLSSGDIFLNDDNVVMDLSGLRAILDWNPETGRLRCEGGAVVSDVLARGLRDDHVLTAVPGTQWLSAGGAASCNVHGKNASRRGAFGESVHAVTLVLASGEIVRCSREEHADLFRAAVGGSGLLGPMVELELDLAPVPSPYVRVRRFTVRTMAEMAASIHEAMETHEFVIGQADTMIGGRRTGRGTIHVADFVERPAGAEEPPADGDGPRFSVLGKWISRCGPVLMTGPGMRSAAAARYYLDAFDPRGSEHVERFPDFNFLMDQIPSYPDCYRHGFVEQQALVAHDGALETIMDLTRLTQQAGFPSLFTAIKAHRADDFFTSFAMDGLSVVFDIPIRPRRAAAQRQLFDDMNELVRERGGRMYLAKDQTLTSAQFLAMYPDAAKTIEAKRRHDPDDLFQSNLYRRLYGAGGDA